MSIRQEWERIAIEGEDVTYKWQSWLIQSSWPRLGKQGPESNLSVEYRDAIHGGVVVAPRRVTLESASGTTAVLSEIRRYAKAVPDMDGVRHDLDDRRTHSFWNEVLVDLLRLYKTSTPSKTMDLTLIGRDRSQSWLIPKLWPGSGATAIAAGGGSGKSFMAQAMAMSLATGFNFLQRMPAREVPVRRVLYLDFESDEGTFVDRAVALAEGFGGIDIDEVAERLRYMNLTGHRLQDMIGKIRTEIAVNDIDAVVVDSMSASVGEGLIDDAIVNAYWDAIARLQRPSLIVVHKSAENVARRKARIFGSIMSENRLRMAWNMEKAETNNGLLLTCFKDNNTGMLNWKWAFLHETEAHDEYHHVLTSAFVATDPDQIILQGDPIEPEPDKATSLGRIAEVFIEHDAYLTYNEIAELAGIPLGSVKSTINRNKNRFVRTADSPTKYKMSVVGADVPR